MRLVLVLPRNPVSILPSEPVLLIRLLPSAVPGSCWDSYNIFQPRLAEGPLTNSNCFFFTWKKAGKSELVEVTEGAVMQRCGCSCEGNRGWEQTQTSVQRRTGPVKRSGPPYKSVCERVCASICLFVCVCAYVCVICLCLTVHVLMLIFVIWMHRYVYFSCVCCPRVFACLCASVRVNKLHDWCLHVHVFVWVHVCLCAYVYVCALCAKETCFLCESVVGCGLCMSMHVCHCAHVHVSAFAWV